MEVYSTEEQQVEALRKWFKKNGKTVLIIAAIVLSVLLAIQYWRHHVNIMKAAASQTYQAMIVAIEQQDGATAKSKANVLISDYERTPYASLAKLYLAKAAVSENQLDQAASHLQWVIDHSKIADFQDLARLRLAKILFAQNKSEAALKLLGQEKNNYFALLEELKGDILVSKNQSQEAKLIYKTAHQAMVKQEINNPLLKMKLEELEEV